MLAIGVEAALRLVAPRFREHLFDARYSGSKPLDINADGFRGPIAAKPKPAGEFRVMALGDSVTLGTGVHTNKVFVEQLCEVLRTSGTIPTAKAVNAGVEGASLRELTYALGHEWSAYEPDVVIVAMTGNFVSQSLIEAEKAAKTPKRPSPAGEETGKRAIVTKLKRSIKQLCLPSFLTLNTQRGLYALGVLTHNIDAKAPYGALLAHGWKQIGLDPLAPEHAWELCERDMAALSAVCTARGARLIVTSVPARFTIGASAWDNEKRVPLERLSIDPPARVAALCSHLTIESIDCATPFRAALAQQSAFSNTDPVYTHVDYTHPDERGHKIIAEQLAAKLTTGRGAR